MGCLIIIIIIIIIILHWLAYSMRSLYKITFIKETYAASLLRVFPRLRGSIAFNPVT